MSQRKQTYTVPQMIAELRAMDHRMIHGSDIFAQCADAIEGKSRTAWVIDNGHEREHRLYMTFDPSMGMFDWTEDIDEALQFARRKDAELCARESEDARVIREHTFVTA